MKNFKIEIPQGYEIDKEKSTFDNIVFNKIENKLPLRYSEIKKDVPIITSEIEIYSMYRDKSSWNLHYNKSTNINRLCAFKALMQLVELRDAWNDGWMADYINGNEFKFNIYFSENKIRTSNTHYVSCVLNFKTGQLRDKFLEQFKELIEQAKELI